jgi:hypothetical protein
MSSKAGRNEVDIESHLARDGRRKEGKGARCAIVGSP